MEIMYETHELRHSKQSNELSNAGVITNTEWIVIVLMWPQILRSNVKSNVFLFYFRWQAVIRWEVSSF